MKLIAVALLLAVVTADRDDAFHHPGRDYSGRHGLNPRPWRPQGRKVDFEVFKNETIQIDVRKTTVAVRPNGVAIDILKVSLRVHVIDANIHINGLKINHAVVTAMFIKTELDEISMNKVIRRRPCVVHVRVMVRETMTQNGIRQLAVQEEILEVDSETVTQIEVQEVLLELGNGKTESNRRITLFKLMKSKIHKQDRKDDVYPFGDRRKPPHHSDNPDDKEDQEAETGETGDKHHHDRHHRRWRLCKWFHRLPLGVRIVSFLTFLIVGIALLSCCIRCMCKKSTRKSAAVVKYEVADNVSEASLDMEAPPLSEKKPIDEMKLIA